MIYDLIVIGSGSVGAAAGWYATRAGLKVLMLDKAQPPHDEASHHGETRLIRHAYGNGFSYVPMVLRAQQLWDELNALTGERIMNRCGVINIGPENSEFIRNVIESARRYHLPVEILTPQAVMQRWPQLNIPDGFVSVFELNSGYLKCELAIEHWIRLAKEAGCTQLFDCPVIGITRDGDMQKVETANGSFVGRKVLLSAGTWLSKLLPELPITPTRKVFSWHRSDDRYNENNNFPGFVIIRDDGNEFYGFPAQDNVFKIGKHSGGQPIKNPEEPTPFGSFPEDETEVQEVVQQFFPGVGLRIYGKSCSYDITPDKGTIFDIIDRSSDLGISYRFVIFLWLQILSSIHSRANRID